MSVALSEIPASAIKRNLRKVEQPTVSKFLLDKKDIMEALSMSSEQIYETRLVDPTFPIIKIPNTPKGRLYADPNRLKKWIDSHYNQQMQTDNDTRQ